MNRNLPVLALLAACGGSEPAHDHDHGDGTHTHDAAGGTPASGETPASKDGGGTAAAADPHAGHHQSGSGHMADMAATREKLRATLGAAYDAPVAGLEGADLATGQHLYNLECASCHGPAGKGDGEAGKGLNPPAADFTDGFHARWYSDAARVHIIREGIEGTAMPGFGAKFGEEELLAVYAYVRSLRPAPTAPPAEAGDDHGAHDHGDGAGTHHH